MLFVRLFWIVYSFGVGAIFISVLGSLIFNESPVFKKRLIIFLSTLIWVLLWPLAVLTKGGRKLLFNTFETV